MEDRNCELLFEYLRSILYDSEVKTLEIDSLDEPFRKLGMGLQYLETAVKEMKQCSAALSKGDLSSFKPARENFLCENLKNIHANLNHLTWQAKQVAKGDYSQTVSYLGEFSEAFNTMTEQLREREKSLKLIAEQEKKHAEMAESYRQLLMELIARSEEEILVISLDGQSLLYSNRRTEDEVRNWDVYKQWISQIVQKKQQEDRRKERYEWKWEAEDSTHRFYAITTGKMKWQGEWAYVNIVQEVTETRVKEEQLKAEAYQDMLTRIGNRFYLKEKAEEILQTGEPVSVCYCDLDHLKYINDTFGHQEGDAYIRFFVRIVNENIREEDIFARIGGDEFCILMRDCAGDDARKRLSDIQKQFVLREKTNYARSFSCGIVGVPRNHDKVDLDTLLAKVDQIGAACHTGNPTCFFQPLVGIDYDETNPLRIFESVYDTIADRKENPKEGSYTNYLFDKGIDKILKKIGEEATEVVIAAKNPNPEEVKYEIADFLYHAMVLMVEKGLTWEDIVKELADR